MSFRTPLISKLYSILLRKNSGWKFEQPYVISSFKWFRKVHSCTALYTNSSNQSSEIFVYEGPLKKRIKIVKLISLSSSMLGFAILPVVVNDLLKVNMFVGCATGVISSVFLSTPFILHWITRRYVIELHFDSESKTFTAKTFNLVTQIKELKFKATDVSVPEFPGMLSSFHVNGVPLFIDSTLVKDPDAYSHMMGYDKPLDFKLHNNEMKESVKT